MQAGVIPARCFQRAFGDEIVDRRGPRNQQVGARAWVWSRAELLDEGLLGTGATGSVPGRIGDVVLRIGKSGVRVPPDVAQAMASFKLGDPVPMLVRRSGFDFWMAFTRR